MRRVLFTAFLSLTAFTVLGGNFLQVTAPNIGGELGDLEARAASVRIRRPFVPAGATRLSAEPIAPTASQVLPAGPVDAELDHAPANGEVHEGPIEVREESADIARVSDAREPLFISTWLELPLAAAHYLGFTGAAPSHPADDVLAERTAPSPDRNASAASHLPRSVKAISEVPKADLSARRAEPLPQAPANEVLNVNGHDIASATTASLSDGRSETTQAERADAPVNTETITAATEAPAADFTRQRIAEEPPSPAFVAPQTATAEHVAINDAAAAGEDRGPSAEADASGSGFGILNYVAALYIAPASVFDRPRLVAEPQAPAPVAIANNEHSAKNDGPVVQDERGNAVSPETTAASTSVLDRFVAAITELPSHLFSPQAPVEQPKAPATDAHVANRHGSDSVASAPVADARDEIASADTAAPTAAPASITAFAETPSSKIAARRLADLPAVPIFIPALKESPVAITAKTSMSTAMLTPMDRKVLVDAPLHGESIMAAANSSDLTTQFDRTVAPVAAADRVAPAIPTLISGRSEYSMDLLKPMSATTVNPFEKLTAQQSPGATPATQQRDGFCDPNWIGPPIRFSQTVELKLEDLLNQLHQRFGVGFIIGQDIANIPLNVKAGSIPWNLLLRSQLFISNVRATCIDNNTIQLVKNDAIPNLQDSAEAKPNFVKLKFLQPGISQNISITGQASGGGGGASGGSGCQGTQGGGGGGSGGGGGGGGSQGCGKFEKLIIEIEKILGIRSPTESVVGQGSSSGGGGGGEGGEDTEVRRTNRSVTVIPGRNILVIRATPDEMALINQIIALADRPPFQVVIRGLVYTANEDKLKDIGGQVSALVGTGNGNVLGGVTSQPNVGPALAPPPNPGGVPTLGDGFLSPVGGGDAIFGVTSIVGTSQFSAQLFLLQKDGVISVKNRPFAVVLDGEGTSLDVGRKIPIIINAVNNLGGDAGELQILDASNILQVIPQVVDDEAGNPIAVNLIMRLESNDVDSSVVTQGVPAIARRSIQSRIILNEEKTVILGGFTVDSDSNTTSKAPGLGDIPGLGWLFKRKVRSTQINRLYFALSVSIVPFGQMIEPVSVPGANTDIPSLTPPMKDRSDKAEPQQVVALPTPKGP
jgi:uncharacterized membrane protein YgcG